MEALAIAHDRREDVLFEDLAGMDRRSLRSPGDGVLLLHGWWVEVEAWDVELLLGLGLVENVESAEGSAVEAGVDLSADPLQEELLKSFVAEALNHRLAVARLSTGVTNRVTARLEDWKDA